MKQCRGCGIALTSGRAVIAGQKGHYVRLSLLDEQAACCAICGIADIWNGQELVLVLDHIDGDATNNARESLRMVANCDAQLPTFKNRNRGKGRHVRRERYGEGKSY